MTKTKHPALIDSQTQLERARAAIRAVQAEDDQLTALEHKADSKIAAAKAERTALEPARAALRTKGAAASAALAEVEEETLLQLTVSWAAEAVQLNAADPIKHHEHVEELVNRLRASVRSGLDTPNNQKHSVPPVVQQALALLPPLDPMDTPVYALGAAVAGVTDWHTRRKSILARVVPDHGNAATVQ